MSAVVEVRGLRVEIGGRAVVDGVSLQAHAGRVTAVIGPSGSGKTTTGLALLGEYPAGGHIEGTVRTPPGGVGYVPQHPAAVLNPARRVGALLRDIAVRGGGGRRDVRERMHQALRLAQLPDPADVLRRFPHQLSGGQQQRVVLAQALLFGARAIVADEPTTGQDALTKQGIVTELAALARQGIAVILLSHDTDVVRQLADEVVVMNAGRVVDRGPAESVLGGASERVAPPPRAPGPRGPVRLETRALTAGHRTARGSVEVLSDIAISVAAGECLALVAAPAAARPPWDGAWRGCTRGTPGASCWTASPCRAACGRAVAHNWPPCSTCSRIRRRPSPNTGRSSTRSPARPSGCVAPAPTTRARKPCGPWRRWA